MVLDWLVVRLAILSIRSVLFYKQGTAFGVMPGVNKPGLVFGFHGIVFRSPALDIANVRHSDLNEQILLGRAR